jgi:hypothetical protein
MHMHPTLCIWNEYAFTKQAHKSSKGGGEYLERVQLHAADGAAVVGMRWS